jgi:predicted transcriptional regulator
MLISYANEVNTMQSVSVKEAAHQLVDQLPEDTNWDKVLFAIQARRDIEAGMADIEAGRLIDGDEVMEWLESWGTENELEPPTL